MLARLTLAALRWLLQRTTTASWDEFSFHHLSNYSCIQIQIIHMPFYNTHAIHPTRRMLAAYFHSLSGRKCEIALQWVSLHLENVEIKKRKLKFKHLRPKGLRQGGQRWMSMLSEVWLYIQNILNSLLTMSHKRMRCWG